MLDLVAGTPAFQGLEHQRRAIARAGKHPDQVLLDLDRELTEYLAVSEPIRIALCAARDAGDRGFPKRPEALTFRERDNWLMLSAGSRLKAGEPIPDGMIEHLRTRDYPTHGECYTGARYREVNERIREILRADATWKKAKDRLHARLNEKYDLDENNKRWDVWDDFRHNIMDRALDAKATTMEGVLVKIHFREWMKDYDPYLDASGSVEGEMANSICDELGAIVSGGRV